MNVVIVDDEKNARAALVAEIKEHCGQLQIVGEADGVHSAVQLINETYPSLVFMDIQLGDGTGFDVLEQLQWKQLKIIFVTAYDKYAIRAFKVNALEYLLKPISSVELVNAVSKAVSLEMTMVQAVATKQLLELGKLGLSNKIAVPVSTGISVFQTDTIVRIEATGNYSTIHLQDGQKLLSSKHLKSFEDMLLHQGFERIHHSHVINLRHLKRYIHKDGNFVEMDNGEVLPVSQRKKTQLLSLLERISI